MNDVVDQLFWIPLLPLLAAAVGAVLPREKRGWAAGLALGALGIAGVMAIRAFVATCGSSDGGSSFRETRGFAWLMIGTEPLRLGWMLDPLTAVMLVMVTVVGFLIFVYSTGYMAEDGNATRFFCFLSLFAAAMLGLVLANSLLLLFICWEVVGLASYLLIGFWYERPAAAAAAKKAFITTKIGDLGFLLGMVWLYSETGTLLLYDDGRGCLDGPVLARLVALGTVGGMAVSTAIALLIFLGAVGKSGQVPLHVWLPDAMEGPTPVSALIHAATMVAAGVFLVARLYPLFSAAADGVAVSGALQVVTWVGAITAVFAALVAVAQTDLKRVLAYSTVSQLGFMMVGLGVGGVAVGMFHLLTHACFKALLFLGAGSVIHGCHEEQDIRAMGGLRGLMPLTFATYAVGMLALAGFPLFSGFWSKDEILHAAAGWPVSRVPFYLSVAGALLTGFYMTRQVVYVFFGSYRGASGGRPHESPAVMTVPLVILAVFAFGLGFVGTPLWPWFQSYLDGHHGDGLTGSGLALMGLSTAVVATGLAVGWRVYGRSRLGPEVPDPLQRSLPLLFTVLERRGYVDEFYEATVVAGCRWFGRACAWLDVMVWQGLVGLASYLVLGLAWMNRWFDDRAVNPGFDGVCDGLRDGGRWVSLVQNGRVQRYLRVMAVAVVVLLILVWGWRS